MSKPGAARAAAAKALFDVLHEGRSLNQALPEASQTLTPADRAFCQAMCFQALRALPSYEWFVNQLLAKPLKSKVRIVHYVLLVGICQLRDLRTPAHAAVGETVNAMPLLKQKALQGLVNGVLRNFQRQQASLEARLASDQQKSASLRTQHPGWLQKRLERAYPDQWERICEANNQPAPLWLRINLQHTSRDAYLDLLQAQGIDAITDQQLPTAIALQKAGDVTALPGFAEGWVSVQDRSAQFAAVLLDAQPGERVLDACSAPGGKTVHILERTPELQVDAMDHDATRLQRVAQNLARMGFSAQIICGDAADPTSWWDGTLYDRILLDAPCSATGVIRRHPDIKWLRRDADIDALVNLQKQILRAQWALLKPGGRLLYATCSVLPQENELQIIEFLEDEPTARVVPIEHAQGHGWQLLPSSLLADGHGGDGFYYCLLEKSTDKA